MKLQGKSLKHTQKFDPSEEIPSSPLFGLPTLTIEAKPNPMCSHRPLKSPPTPFNKMPSKGYVSDGDADTGSEKESIKPKGVLRTPKKQHNYRWNPYNNDYKMALSYVVSPNNRAPKAPWGKIYELPTSSDEVTRAETQADITNTKGSNYCSEGNKIETVNLTTNNPPSPKVKVETIDLTENEPSTPTKSIKHEGHDLVDPDETELEESDSDSGRPNIAASPPYYGTPENGYNKATSTPPTTPHPIKTPRKTFDLNLYDPDETELEESDTESEHTSSPSKKLSPRKETATPIVDPDETEEEDQSDAESDDTVVAYLVSKGLLPKRDQEPIVDPDETEEDSDLTQDEEEQLILQTAYHLEDLEHYSFLADSTYY
ncbi:Protein of unknown function [Pyronema omphalodes CBS 100304]|uniref:Uncharacterized protein n=1 Tax=Pyronema omphalodes (strain CBS 100304) TaxID=1076935 RepID=U4KW76_PYROM|nr:Protein of unknown function [Pyronema omphalodes CBS 100304]